MASLLGNTTRRPDIAFHKSGRIEINARIARALTLRRGDVIDVDSSQGEYYLRVRYRAALGSHEAKVYPTGPHTGHFRCRSLRLCSSVLSIAGLRDGQVGRFPCGEPVVKQDEIYIPIIIRFNIPGANEQRD